MMNVREFRDEYELTDGTWLRIYIANDAHGSMVEAHTHLKADRKTIIKCYPDKRAWDNKYSGEIHRLRYMKKYPTEEELWHINKYNKREGIAHRVR